MKSRSLSIRFLWLGLAGITMLVLTSVIWHFTQKQDAQLAIEQSTEDKLPFIQQIVDLEAGPAKTFLNQSSRSDELIQSLEGRDVKWIEHSLDAPSKDVGVDVVALFTPNWKPVYVTSTASKFAEIANERLKARLKGNAEALEFFAEIDGTLYRVFASNIYAENDLKGTGKTYGSMILASEWKESKLARIANLTASKVSTAEPPNAEAIGQLYVPLEFSGLDGEPVKTLYFKLTSRELADALEGSRDTSVSLIFIVLLIFALFTVLLNRWVIHPTNTLAKALECEQSDLVEPWVHEFSEIGRLALTVQLMFEQREELRSLNSSLQEYQSKTDEINRELSELNLDLEQRVLERTQELEDAIESTIIGWSKAMDSRDHETEGHTQRVAAMAERLGIAAGLTAKELRTLRFGSLLHDIGKIGIPDAILLNSRKLSDEEFAVMKRHTIIAYDMLKDIHFLERALYIPYLHHEKWDGTGYPLGLAGEDIPYMTRLFSVADVWDALRSNRPYRQAWTEAKVREHISSLSGTHFDPQVVELFMSLEPMAHPSDADMNLDQAA